MVVEEEEEQVAGAVAVLLLAYHLQPARTLVLLRQPSRWASVVDLLGFIPLCRALRESLQPAQTPAMEVEDSWAEEH